MNIRNVAVYDGDRNSIGDYAAAGILSVRTVDIAAIYDDVLRELILFE